MAALEVKAKTAALKYLEVENYVPPEEAVEEEVKELYVRRDDEIDREAQAAEMARLLRRPSYLALAWPS